MTPPRVKTIALVDPLWIGHHPMYFSQFTASFLRAGARVIGLCPEPGDARKALDLALGEDTSRRFAGQIHYLPLNDWKYSLLSGSHGNDPLRTFSRWKQAAETLSQAEAASGLRADLVYFPYLDSYLRFLPISAIPGVLLNRPWSGLYLRNHHHGETPSLKKSLRLLAKGDALIRSNLCRGIGVLDERFIPAMEESGIQATAYPDVTQTGLPAEPFPPALEIQRKAAGRKIIGMIGLERRKGLLTILRTAQFAREAGHPYYFACAGNMNFSEFTMEEQAEIHALSDGVGNVFFDPKTGRIPNEEDYNSLFNTFHIAWAAYEGFEGSSGTLGKAAAFEIPCLATAGECVGNRVESYHLGLTIPEGDAAQALAVIPLLAAGTDRQGNPLSPRFEDYRNHHSQERLDRILRELLETV
jgi:hypothetical protein